MSSAEAIAVRTSGPKDRIVWPNSRQFAFTVCDDTDWATVDNVSPVYDTLLEFGFRTTKLVWVSRGNGEATNPGSTCEDGAYLSWLGFLQRRGFEIALHNAAPTTSTREETRRALERFRDLFGAFPSLHCNHVGCSENIYWGEDRLSGWRRAAYNVATWGKRRKAYRGHVEGDPLFWGDLCRERVRYVRNFVFDDLNTLGVCPEMPYHDPSRPYVNFWFAAANGGSVERFLRLFTMSRIDSLAEAGGLCIAYVHFAQRFARNGKLDPEVRKRLERIASLGGWLAPVSEILDYLRGASGVVERTISPDRLRSLETRWLLERIRKRGTT